jgi:two-component system, response regulator PdtaR
MNFATARVLTVEDDPIVRADLRLVLEDAGFDVCGDARDGVEAVEMARAFTPDLILLDLGLPRLGGVEATRAILSERTVPIVALTGRSPRLADEALAAGAVASIRKPFAVDHLVRTVRDALAPVEAAVELAPERAQSRAVLGDLLGLLGYPEDWAVELEEKAWKSGRVWRRGA